MTDPRSLAEEFALAWSHALPGRQAAERNAVLRALAPPALPPTRAELERKLVANPRFVPAARQGQGVTIVGARPTLD
jgi:hypothetical protein